MIDQRFSSGRDMNIFIDTEFGHDDWADVDLISIGLVAADGRTFYAERLDFDLALVNAFVRENVMPLLRADGVLVLSTCALRSATLAWLEQFKYDDAVVCFDNPIGWALLSQLLDQDLPTWLGSRNIRDQIDWNVRKQFFMQTQLPEHHALHDAHASRFAVMSDPFSRFMGGVS